MTYVRQSSFYSIGARKSSASPPAPVAVKYHPGFYVALFKANTLIRPPATQLSLTDQRNELINNACLRGWQARFNLRELEGSFGNYAIGYAAIDALLDQLPAGKRLVVLFEYKSSHTENRLLADHVCPDYMLGPLYDNGEFLYDSTNLANPGDAGGYELPLWNPNVIDRLIALSQALGARYNNDDRFEGIGLTEAAFQIPLITVTTDWYDQSWIGLFKMVVAMKQSFPNSFVYFFMNYARSHLNRAINGGTFGSIAEGQYTTPGIKNLGIALGGPDIVYNDYGLGGYDSSKPSPGIISNPPGIYSYYPQMSHLIPLCPSMQRTGFLRTQINLPLTPGGSTFPPVESIVDYGKNNLKANYIFVTRATAQGSNPDSWATFIAYLNANPSVRDSVTGGLDAIKPACYPAITTT